LTSTGLAARVVAEINVHFTDMIDKVAFIWKLTQLGQREH